MLGPADMSGLPAEAYKCLVVGQQAATKGRQDSQALNKVQVRVRRRAAACSWRGLWCWPEDACTTPKL